MEHTTVALDEGVDEAASEQLECCCFLTCEQEVTERILDVTRIDEEGGGTSMEGLLAVRIVSVESVPQQVSEQMVVPVGVSGQLDEEEVPLVDTAEQIAPASRRSVTAAQRSGSSTSRIEVASRKSRISAGWRSRTSVPRKSVMERGVFANSVRKRSGTDSSRRETAQPSGRRRPNPQCGP